MWSVFFNLAMSAKQITVIMTNLFSGELGKWTLCKNWQILLLVVYVLWMIGRRSIYVLLLAFSCHTYIELSDRQGSGPTKLE